MVVIEILLFKKIPGIMGRRLLAAVLLIGLGFSIPTWADMIDSKTLLPDAVAEKTESFVGPQLPESQSTTDLQTPCSQDKIFQQLRKTFELGFKTGIPAKLKNELVGLRQESDQLALIALSEKTESKLEINNLVNSALAHLERFVLLIPKVTSHAPVVRNQYVIPLEIATRDTDSASCTVVGSPKSRGIYDTVNEELLRLNTNLYTIQTLSPHEYIAYQSELNSMITEYNKTQSSEIAINIQKRIPEIIHNMQNKVETILPSFEISKKYISIVGI